MKKFSILMLLLINTLCSHGVIADDTDTEATYSIKIVSPKEGDTTHNEEPLTISVSVTPGLEPDDTVDFLVDGESAGEPEHTTSISLPPLERGEHTLQAKLIGANGVKAESEIITLYQQKHSILLGPGPSPKTKVNQMGSETGGH